MKNIFNQLTILNVWFPMLIGGLIYLLYRPLNLILFDGVKLLGMLDFVLVIRSALAPFRPPEIILYSLPDGIWMYCLTFIMLSHFKGSKHSELYAYLGLILAITSEFGQLLHLIEGTFDYVDIYFYFFGYIFAITVIRLKENKTTKVSPVIRKECNLSNDEKT